jgi:hypothetical protein
MSLLFTGWLASERGSSPTHSATLKLLGLDRRSNRGQGPLRVATGSGDWRLLPVVLNRLSRLKQQHTRQAQQHAPLSQREPHSLA